MSKLDSDTIPRLGDGGIKAVIFDLDGTIANTLPFAVKAFQHSIEPLSGKKLSYQDIVATFGPTEEGTIMALVPDRYEEGLAGYLHYYREFHDECPDLFDGMRALLENLKKNQILLAMVTGKGHKSTQITLEKFNLGHIFTHVETGSPKGVIKAECIAKVVAEWSAVGRDEVIYVGDAPGDIVASRKAGVKIVSAAWAENTNVEGLMALSPDEIFFTVSDFADWLQLNICPPNED